MSKEEHRIDPCRPSCRYIAGQERRARNGNQGRCRRYGIPAVTPYNLLEITRAIAKPKGNPMMMPLATMASVSPGVIPTTLPADAPNAIRIYRSRCSGASWNTTSHRKARSLR